MSLQYSSVTEAVEALPAMSPYAMRQENLVFNRSNQRGTAVIEPAHPPPAAPVPTPVPTPAPTFAPTFAPTPAPELPAAVYVLLAANAVTIALCLLLLMRRR
jgi:hypothetical protein